MIGKII